MVASVLQARILRIVQPADVVRELNLPDFNSSEWPTRDLRDNIAQLTELRYPTWHRGFTIASDVLLTSFVLVASAVIAWRIVRKSFWILRWQQGHLVFNGVNTTVIVGGVATLVWVGNSSILLRHSYQPSVHLLSVIMVWLLGWAVGWSSVYCIPSATPFGRKGFSAKQMNVFFLGMPVIFCVHALSWGVVAQVKWSAALSVNSGFMEMLHMQPDSAPVSPAQLEAALKVWSSFVSAWTFGSVLYFACGVWASAAALLFLIIHVLLAIELQRQKREHLAISAVGTVIDPVWNEPGSDGVDMDSLIVTANRTILYQDKLDAAGFFPPFRPAPSVALADSNFLFRKCLRNIRACSLLSVGALALTACICLYAGFVSATSIANENRRDYMRAHLTVQLLVTASYLLGGAAAIYESLCQSLQPVLIASSVSGDASSRTKVHSASQGDSGFKTISQSFLNSMTRLPKTTGSRLERFSTLSCETKSTSHRERLHSSPPEPPEALISLSVHVESDDNNDASHDPTVASSFQRIKSVPDLREAPLLPDSFSATSRDTSQPSRAEPEILSYDEVRQMRGYPVRAAQPPRVSFVRETNTTYETVRPPPRARRSEQPYVHSWRKPTS